MWVTHHFESLISDATGLNKVYSHGILFLEHLKQNTVNCVTSQTAYMMQLRSLFYEELPTVPLDTLTVPFSMTRLSMTTALVFCCHTISQKSPHVFSSGPCREQTILNIIITITVIIVIKATLLCIYWQAFQFHSCQICKLTRQRNWPLSPQHFQSTQSTMC